MSEVVYLTPFLDLGLMLVLLAVVILVVAKAFERKSYVYRKYLTFRVEIIL